MVKLHPHAVGEQPPPPPPRFVDSGSTPKCRSCPWSRCRGTSNAWQLSISRRSFWWRFGREEMDSRHVWLPAQVMWSFVDARFYLIVKALRLFSRLFSSEAAIWGGRFYTDQENQAQEHVFCRPFLFGALVHWRVFKLIGNWEAITYYILLLPIIVYQILPFESVYLFKTLCRHFNFFKKIITIISMFLAIQHIDGHDKKTVFLIRSNSKASACKFLYQRGLLIWL